MAWKPGQSGNPDGPVKQKKFLGALERAIAQDSGESLRKAALALLNNAASGEPWAIQMLADRLDGKPKQETETHVDVAGTIEHRSVQEVDSAFADVLARVASTDSAPSLPH